MKIKLLVCLVVMLAITPLNAIASFDSSSTESYLQAHSNNAWSTMALTALGSSSIPTNHLKSISGTKALDFTAPILAITALDQNPRTFGNKDYVAELKKFHTGGQIGDSSTLNDDIFGLLALVSAGEAEDSMATDAKSFILNHQQSDGGWGFLANGGSDSNMTAAAIAALVASGTAPSNTKITNGLNYLRTTQNDDGGFTYDPTSSYGTDSDSSSTAWVIWALNAVSANQNEWLKSGNSPTQYLESNQTSAGYFTYQGGSPEDTFTPVTTAYAAIALSGKTLPLNIVESEPTFEFRIEGKNNTVCSGKVAAVNALDIVKNASVKCGFTYNIQELSFGPYLDQIEDDVAAGVIGWLYLINYNSPSVGANDYILQPGDSVVWYYGDFNWKPSRLSLNPTEIDSGGSSVATVEQFSDNTWSALAGAKVYFGTVEASAGNNGKVTISPPDGYYKVFSETEGFIRSNGELLQVGEPTTTDVGLNVNIEAGQVEGATIAFTVNPGSIDFGTLKSGQNNTQNLSIKNTGTVNISVSGVVKGDDIFVSNLSIDESIWSKLNKYLSPDQTEDVSVKLTIPTSYSGSGSKTGKLTFWAIGE